MSKVSKKVPQGQGYKKKQMSKVSKKYIKVQGINTVPKGPRYPKVT